MENVTMSPKSPTKDVLIKKNPSSVEMTNAMPLRWNAVLKYQNASKAKNPFLALLENVFETLTLANYKQKKMQ